MNEWLPVELYVMLVDVGRATLLTIKQGDGISHLQLVVLEALGRLDDARTIYDHVFDKQALVTLSINAFDHLI